MWSSPEVWPRLVVEAAQVWRYRVGQDAWAHALLNADERERAGRMRAGLPREEFVAARGLLRTVLGAAVGVRAAELRFAVGAQGKPRLESAAGVEFNVSHARGLVLVALSRFGAVGVDVEPVDRAVEMLELSEAHFHPEEVARLRAASEPAEVFFRCWTRKEAVVKADGRGLQVPLAEFCVLPTGEDSGLVRVEVPGGAAVWVGDLAVGEGFRAALAVPNRETQVDCFDFRPAWDRAPH